MDKFLVNMAVVKVNWDTSQGDILDNYIPLIGYVLRHTTEDVVSVEEFKTKFREVAEFDIPTGAIITLLKRALKKYRYIEKQQSGIYRIKKDAIENSEFIAKRDTEQRKYNQLKTAFITYCYRTFGIQLDLAEVDKYFFDVLFEIAPYLFANVSDIDGLQIKPSERRTYLIGKFISHAFQNDQTSFESIVSFVRGAMLTETFYYSHPADIKSKMRKVQVFFDTQFLLRALGYADSAFTIPCTELIDMLRGMSVKLKCFQQTLNEVRNILFAAASQLRQYGRLRANRPGDVFDYFMRKYFSASDVELELAKLEENLDALGITVDEPPEHVNAYGIDETALSKEIDTEIPHQTIASRNHDIDCLTAIHRLRFGKPQKYLESCVAIFITTNAAIARASTRFFNTEYGISDAPVCMADQVFTTLIWLKAVKKAPDMPKDRLVATCYAALLPSEQLWEKYVNEANRLRQKGTIREEDYAVLVHSLEARNRLMDLTFGEDDIVQGTLEQVLNSAKAVYVAEVAEELEGVKQINQAQESRVLEVAKKWSQMVRGFVFYSLIILWIGLLLFGLLKTSPDDLSVSKIFSLESWAFLVLLCVTLLNLIFGYKIKDMCNSFSGIVESKVKQLIEKTFIA